MFVQCISKGLVQSNVYVISENGEGIIIDCGCSAEKIIDVINRQEISVKHLILTHGHFDHIYYIDSIRELTDIHVHIHEADADYLFDPEKNGLFFFASENRTTFAPADHLFKDGDMLEVGGIHFKIIHTPGHTPGGICIFAENCVFTGDTLFRSSIGRTDFPGGSYTAIQESIKNKLFTLPDETVVYPGHGGTTQIGFEKRSNPYVRK